MQLIRHHLKIITMQTPMPNAIAILQDLLGLSGQEIAKLVGRSQPQVVLYRSNLTPIPDDVKAKLIMLLKEARKTVRQEEDKVEGAAATMLEAIAELINEALEQMKD